MVGRPAAIRESTRHLSSAVKKMSERKPVISGTHNALWLLAIPIPKGLIICITPAGAESSEMAMHQRSTDSLPLGTPGSWIAEGHVTCSIQCSARTGDRRVSVDLRLATLPQDLPWSAIARRLVCKACGTAGSVNIVPNWHDRTAAPVPFTKHWKT
jgi:hypothetical protein